MQHIMIVTASTGDGHSAAHYLKQSFEERGIFALPMTCLRRRAKPRTRDARRVSCACGKSESLWPRCISGRPKQINDAFQYTLYRTVFRLNYLLDKIELKNC